ncbi:MAG: guanylate kinase [Lachnospiraceae bacterium]|nr:guanylate kinase [Lachnospiraceae bacterium]
MNRRGILLVISGFAGSGKGTICKELMKRHDHYAFSVSATTRDPRPGEADGVDYFYVTKERFEEMIAQGELLEYASYVSNYYGTPRAYVEEKLSSGMDVILEIECQGALQVKELFPEALLFFVMPPTVEEIYNRLHKRGTETEEVIMKRMRRGSEEAEVIEQYDYLLINDDLDEAVALLENTVNCSRYLVRRNTGQLRVVRQQFEEFFNDHPE